MRGTRCAWCNRGRLFDDGLKHMDDQHDALWLAHVMRLGILPTGYIYPKSKRGLRDLARQRMRLGSASRLAHYLGAEPGSGAPPP